MVGGHIHRIHGLGPVAAVQQWIAGRRFDASARIHALLPGSAAIGLFLGTAIHDTSQVVGAALTYRQIYDDDAVLRVAAGLERSSSHPIARAIRAAAAARGVAMPAASAVAETPGVGVQGVVDGVWWSLSAGGPGEVRVASAEGMVGVIHLRDTRRADATAAVSRLRGLARVAVLTGDRAAPAAAMAEQVGPDELHAEMTPDRKRAWIAAEQAAGRRVLFVGDGLNEGPALVAADVGLAMRGGATASVLAADGVVVEDALGPVVAALRTGAVVRSVVRANMARSIVYNVTAVALAMAGYVDPLVAAIAMPVSSLLVLWGGMRVEPRLRRIEARDVEGTWTSS